MLALAWLLAAATLASAQPALERSDLEAWAEDLRAEDPAKRARAVERLGHLPPSALGAIDARVAYTRRQIIPGEDGYDALRAFRHATGSRRADDMVDIEPGILPTLAERRDAIIGRSAERLLLIRSLERMGTLEAQRRIGDVLALTPEMWRWERRRIVHRHGEALLPALVVLRGHDDRDVRRWARVSIDELGMSNPATALQTEDLGRLAELVGAYAEIRELDAMPVTISFVDHPDDRVREAARAAMEAYGRNALWQFRIAFRHKLDEEAPLEWGWRRTMRALYERLDERRLAPVNARIDAALEALEAGRHEEAERALDAVLRDAPEPPRPGIVGDALLRLGVARGDELGGLRRALWLAPDAPEAARWRGRRIFLEAEADRARGVLDAEGYREAARLDPRAEHGERVAELLGEEVPVEAAPRAEGGEAAVAEAAPGGRGWVWLLALGLFGGALFVLRRDLAQVARKLGAKARSRAAASAEKSAGSSAGSEDALEDPEAAPGRGARLRARLAAGLAAGRERASEWMSRSAGLRRLRRAWTIWRGRTGRTSSSDRAQGRAHAAGGRPSPRRPERKTRAAAKGPRPKTTARAAKAVDAPTWLFGGSGAGRESGAPAAPGPAETERAASEPAEPRRAASTQLGSEGSTQGAPGGVEALIFGAARAPARPRGPASPQPVDAAQALVLGGAHDTWVATPDAPDATEPGLAPRGASDTWVQEGGAADGEAPSEGAEGPRTEPDVPAPTGPEGAASDPMAALLLGSPTESDTLPGAPAPH
ncbi:MAG TPA: hypothetical protein RMH85_10370 [Polyangiaceae bacterium LLY-WYZ-15_(1-7)]|nr:hypothetical protein [Polyangiaceae bacterium LLY-WYZ-15_(1-7)]HJL08896.1 hypothetical protein [Polyangiaceae bacterium LLY-WYZ-15_(1-7)]HJL27342.1 hypothetical protein [Polyangiaceae bacterium LLY-WYZ-15_(1-7)]HJL35572.1 hypothetical protein [Polyangiaceae bacterium LLY-WYZ-15_(1-7)]